MSEITASEVLSPEADKAESGLAGIPWLEGWLTLAGAGRFLGLSRARVYQMVEEGKIESCHRVPDSRVYVVRQAEMQSIKATWAQEASARAAALAM